MKRYNCTNTCCAIQEDIEGIYILLSDYEALQHRAERAEAERDALKDVLHNCKTDLYQTRDILALDGIVNYDELVEEINADLAAAESALLLLDPAQEAARPWRTAMNSQDRALLTELLRLAEKATDAPWHHEAAATSAPEGLHKLVEKWRDHAAADKASDEKYWTRRLRPDWKAEMDCADELEATLSAAERGK